MLPQAPQAKRLNFLAGSVTYTNILLSLHTLSSGMLTVMSMELNKRPMISPTWNGSFNLDSFTGSPAALKCARQASKLALLSPCVRECCALSSMHPSKGAGTSAANAPMLTHN